MPVITPADAASWLRDDSLATDPSFIQVVEFTNDLIDEAWTNPVDPVPARIKLLALGVAARAWTRNPAASHLESVTRSLDDAARTERYRDTANDGTVFLTNDELAILQGRRQTRSVRLIAYGGCC